MKIKTSELTGAALDWAVAKCEGALHPLGNVVIEGKSLWLAVDGEAHTYMEEDVEYTPSTDWSQGGPIIEREHITPMFDGSEWCAGVSEQVSCGGDPAFSTRLYDGPTPLIAAMRCYVASELGDEVDVPEGLA